MSILSVMSSLILYFLKLNFKPNSVSNEVERGGICM